MIKYCDFTSKEFRQKCKGGRVAKTVRVKYNHREEDVFYLCEECAEGMLEQAQNNNWKITARDYVHPK